MKHSFLIVLNLALLLRAAAAEPSYAETLKAARERLSVLEAERSDYRKLKPILPLPQEEERLRLLGQLLADDPVWVLGQQVEADISATANLRSKRPADVSTLDALKDLLVIINSFEERATSRSQAEKIALALREFVVRRDIDGAAAWAKLQ